MIEYDNLGKKGGKDKGREERLTGRDGTTEGGKEGILGKKRGEEERRNGRKDVGWEGQGGWRDKRGGWQVAESFVAVGNCVALNR